MKLRSILIAAVAALTAVVSVRADEPFRNHRYDSFKAGRVNENSIVFVGNSITNMGCWSETFNDDQRCLNRGNSGAVSRETLENIESVLIGHPAKIYLMIGTNDIGEGYGVQVPFDNVKTILERIQDESPATDIYLTSVFPSEVGIRTLAAESELNEMYKTLVVGDKIHYLDLYDALMQIVTGEISLDNLHMSPKGYKTWCDAAAEISGDATLVSSLISADDMTCPQCGVSASNGMRNQMFCELPSYSDDVWIFGDEMVNGGVWHELFNLPNVKNRGWNWGFGGMTISNYTTFLQNVLSNDNTKMTKKAPKQIFFYVGSSELTSSTAAATVKSRYKTLITTAQSIAPDAELFILSLTPHTTTAYNTRVQSYNEQFEAVASETGVKYIDLFNPLANANGTPNAEYLPTQYVWGKGYLKIAQILAPYITGADVMTDEEFDAQYATINARNTLGVAVTAAKVIVADAKISEKYITRLQNAINEANELLRTSSREADKFTKMAESLSELTSALSTLADSAPTDGKTYRESFIEQLEALEASLTDLNIGDDYGQYSITYEGWDDDMATLKDMLAEGSTSYDELECAMCLSRLQDAVTNVSINLPKPGSYIRVKASKNYVANNTSRFNGTATYLSATCQQNTVNSATDYQAVCVSSKTDDNEESTIFYYAPLEGSQYGNFLTYAGRYAYTGKGNMLGFHQGSAAENASVATTVGFQEALAENGAYHFRYNIQGDNIESARVLAIEGNGEVVNGGSATSTTLKSFVWSNVELESVTTLPVTIDSDGTATFSVPVAVTVPTDNDIEVFVTTESDGVLTLHQVAGGESFAAGTAFIIGGTADKVVHFDIADAATANESYVCNDVHSSPALGSFSSTDGITTFAKSVAIYLDAPALRANSSDGASTVTFTSMSDGCTVLANAPSIDVATSKLSSATQESFNVPLTKGSDGGDLLISLTTGEEIGTNSISTVVVERLDGTSTIFDLQGRRVKNPTNGFYIVDGKVVRI